MDGLIETKECMVFVSVRECVIVLLPRITMGGAASGAAVVSTTCRCSTNTTRGVMVNYEVLICVDGKQNQKAKTHPRASQILLFFIGIVNIVQHSTALHSIAS